MPSVVRICAPVLTLCMCVGVTTLVAQSGAPRPRDAAPVARVAQANLEGLPEPREPVPLPSRAAPAASRVALVIGNAAYDESPLRNTVNDATAMATTLQQLGFTVTLERNVNHQRMAEAVNVFSRQLRPDSVGLFYFAGHGVQVEGGNYLVPLGVPLRSGADVKFQTVAAEWVQARMMEAGNPQNIVILDACRNAPFLRQWRNSQYGLAPMQPGGGVLIAYATSPGSVAFDGKATDIHGVYTKHLLHVMMTPNLPVEQMFKAVRVAVERETKGKQTPWELSSLRGDFSFRPTPPATNNVPASETLPRVIEGTPVALGSPPAQLPTPPKPGVTKDGGKMVFVPSGEFLMGTSAEEIERLLQEWPHTQREVLTREHPQHRVYLDAFFLDKYEVTNARFQQFVKETGHRTQAEREGWAWIYTGKSWEKASGATWRTPWGRESTIARLEHHPVVQVSWEDARAYCTWAGKRLPTEAEWEKAAQGKDGGSYPWGTQFDGPWANFCDAECTAAWKDHGVQDGYQYTAPVGSYKHGQSRYGAYDMAGNVWEWVSDRFDRTYYRNSPVRSPRGPLAGNEVVLRGGAWDNPAVFVRTPNRNKSLPTSRYVHVGLRCAKTS